MKKRIFDFVVIISIAAFLITLNELDLLEQYARFMFVPIFAFYLIGQYAERKFPS